MHLWGGIRMARSFGRRLARQQLHLVAVLALGGCTAATDLDGLRRTDTQPPALDGASGADFGADAAGSEADAHTCSPQTEQCDGRDNDCDGIVDNGFDLSSDPAHCGACGNECDLASPYCLGEGGTFSCSNGCDDGRLGGDERDVDCGGALCPACAVGQRCTADDDCRGSAVCELGRCAACGICEPGTEDLESCQGCGSGTRRRRCTEQCQWGTWGQCSAGQRLCDAGQRETRTCGRCGEQSRQCSASCDWDSWGNCSGQGMCTAGQVQTRPCGFGGRQRRRCSETCAWGNWGGCEGEGECAPDDEQLRSCGRCGTQRRFCEEDYRWTGWSTCNGEGACQPGQRETRQCGDCPEGVQTRQCGADCRWTQWSRCDESALSCAAPGEVRGYISLRQRNGQQELVGWACDSSISRSISVHIYVGGPAGQGSYLRSVQANLGNEAAVNTACETSGSRHRFVVPLTEAELRAHAGRSIHAYGISLRDGPNRALNNSGRHRIPSGDTAGTRLSELARTGQDLTIAAGQEVVIDDNVSLRLLRVQGTLRCRRDVGDYRLRLAGILVTGQLLCGSQNAPFSGKLELAIDDGVPLMSMGPRTIAVAQPGVLRLHGNTARSGWVKLAQSVAAGQRRLVVDRDVRFERGDLLAIGPTGFNPYEAEQVTVDRVEDRRVIHLRQPLRYPHHGRTQQIRVGDRTRTLDQRAEVADLTRHIRIFPTGAPSSHNRLGAHLMVMRGARAFVDAVEFSRMGRLGEMGRYPFHWHLAGNVRGQFIINSSIHHSYQRCVTVHGTNEALVRNNVCFDHVGHGYFLEDGNEVRNRIVNNLGMLSRRAPEERSLLVSDVKGNPIRFSAPGTFWITHPDNYVAGNVASGSAGSGFWMSFQQALRCNANGCAINTDNPNVRPLSAPTWVFEGNTAHTCDVGFTWDGAADGALRNNPRNPNDRELVNRHYAPPTIPTFSRLVGFKNIHTGVYFRGRTVRFDDNLYADNGWSLFFTFNQVVTNSTVVGTSASFAPRDRDYLHRRGKRSGQRGIVLYDGPFDLRNVDFVDYPTQRIMYAGHDVTAVPFVRIGGANKFTNVVSNLRFSPEPFRRVNVSVPNTPVGSQHMNSLRDLDGSLTGQEDVLVVPDHPLNDHRGCQRRADWGALVCNHRVGLLFFNDPDIAYRILRSDGAQSVARPADAVGHQNNKFNMILDSGYSYRLQLAAAYRRNPNLRVRFQAERVGAASPVVQLEGIGRNCRLVGAAAVSSLAQLQRQTRSAYLSAGSNFYIRMVTDRAQATSALARSALSDAIPLRCEE